MTDLRARLAATFGLRDLRSLAKLDLGPAYAGCVPRKRAIRTWRGLVKHVGETGYWPLLVGADEQGWLEEALRSKRPTTKSILAAATRLDPLETDAEVGNEKLPARRVRSRPNDSGFAIPRSGRDQLAVWLLPTSDPATIPALLRFGGWNDCPDAERHVERLRAWHDRWGAVPVAVEHDTLELHVERPPLTRTDALAVAREHYAYCQDIVDQGCGSIAKLARGLQGARHWFFWWD